MVMRTCWVLLGILAVGCGGAGAQATRGSFAATTRQADAPRVTRLARPGWVEVVAQVIASNDESPASARNRALIVARRAAVQEVAGVAVTSGTVSFLSLRAGETSELAQMLGFTRSEAVIVDERPGPERIEPIQGGYRLEVSLQARVLDRRAEADPGFRIEIDLGGERFLHGDLLTLSVRSTRDVRLIAVNVTDEGAVVLLPNRFLSEVVVDADQRLVFPGPDLAARGVVLRAQVPPGERRVLETLLVIAVRADRRVRAWESAGVSQADFRVEEGGEAVRMLGDILAPLADLPPKDWTMAQVAYEVTAR